MTPNIEIITSYLNSFTMWWESEMLSPGIVCSGLGLGLREGEQDAPLFGSAAWDVRINETKRLMLKNRTWVSKAVWAQTTTPQPAHGAVFPSIIWVNSKVMKNIATWYLSWELVHYLDKTFRTLNPFLLRTSEMSKSNEMFKDVPAKNADYLPLCTWDLVLISVETK